MSGDGGDEMGKVRGIGMYIEEAKTGGSRRRHGWAEEEWLAHNKLFVDDVECKIRGDTEVMWMWMWSPARWQPRKPLSIR